MQFETRLFIFMVGAGIVALLIALIHARWKYSKEMRELFENHKKEMSKALDVQRIHFNKVFETYPRYADLPKPGQPEVLYYVADTTNHFYWHNGGYKMIWFEKFGAKPEKTYELSVKLLEGGHAAYESVSVDKKHFNFSKFMKWYMCSEQELFQMDLIDGFDIIRRSQIKHVSYRVKQ